ncbi:MAG: TlpA disulfide reductase family protein [Bacteroidota bacterium]
MKKLLAFLLLFKLGIIDTSAGTGKTIIKCTINGYKPGTGLNSVPAGLQLFQVKNGAALNLGFQRPDKNGNFTFNVEDVKEGIYFFQRAGTKGATFKHAIYLKAGEQKRVNFYNNYDSCVVDKPGAETKGLQAWTDAITRYCKSVRDERKHAETYRQYDAFVKFASSFLKSNKTPNAFFNAWMADKVDTDLRYLRAANFFYFNERLYSKYDSSAAVAAFYQPLEDINMVNDARLLRSENGLKLLHNVFGYLKFKRVKNVKDLQASHYSEYYPLISNNDIKVTYIATKMKEIRKYEDFVKYVEPYHNLFTTTALKAAYQKRYEELYLFAKGTPGYDFELKDVNDKTYRLSDFKGKVLVIDIWAMWCGACLNEMPYFQKVEEAFKDNDNIAFIGLSHDGLARKDVWKNFVAKRGWANVQLIENYNESVGKYYKIEGIPRYLIFDKEGKIVTVDAPRPSDPAFKKLIEQTLALAK